MPESRRRSADKWRRTIGDRRLDHGADADRSPSSRSTASTPRPSRLCRQRRQVARCQRPERAQRSDARALRKIVPQDGTSLENAFTVIGQLSPQPDNVIIVTDGLPTQGATPPTVRKTVDGDQRLKLFERALARMPARIPVNVILLPMEGDPMAPTAFWALTRKTGGSSSARRRTGHEDPPRSPRYRDLQHVVPGRDLLRVRRGHPAARAEQSSASRSARAKPGRSSRGG